MEYLLQPEVRAELEERIRRIEEGERPEPFTTLDWVYMWVVTAVVLFLFVALVINLLLHRS
ncbi:MAG: hypothetical protein RMK01_02350 [Thermomicrobium sp.]|nr:hypothetical protein [Thermomicrobium sp.]MDW8058898.1 hypothetical protein [Thermomicrobium sp.]